jgi:predicted dinucleotide-binding enzyme
MNKQIGVLGSGIVGQILANGLRELGYKVVVGNRSGHKVDNWDGPVGTFAEVATKADVIVLAVKGAAAEEVVSYIKDQIIKKVVIDTTNPISEKPPVDGVINFFTSLNDSLMERLQSKAPNSYFVKAFNSVGSATMVNPSYQEGKPSMFICGNNQSAKKEVAEILNKLGWQTEDMGKATSARAIEPLCILWCIPGILNNQWSHAFKLLKK